MKVTIDKIKELGANQQWINFLENNFTKKSKINIEDIVRDLRAPAEFLYWLDHYIGYTPKEKKIYNERFKIVESEGVTESSDIKYSKFIMNCD